MKKSTARPSANLNCVAAQYAAPPERIIEFHTKRGVGGLISITDLENGSVSVSIYSCDAGVQVSTDAEHIYRLVNGLITRIGA